MQITLNGTRHKTEAADLAALLIEQNFGPKVATALNGSFVPATLRAQTPISEGDLIEVLSPMQGG